MISRRKLRMLRAAFLVCLMVLLQACAGGYSGSAAPGELGQAQGRGDPHGPTSIDPQDEIRKVSVKTLSNCSGDRFSIDLLDAIGALPEDTLDAQREQLRDWIWTVTLSRIAQRTSAEEVLSSVADEPLVRDDALAHVLHMQVGPTRSTTTKSGGAVVLVETADAEAMNAEVLEAIDEEALHLGRMPAKVQVYQVAFQPELARADVCTMNELGQAEIKSAARAYRSATITTTAELEGFLSGGVDLLSAQCTNVGLQVTGRQRPRSAQAPFTVEHVAALAQPLGVRYIPIARFGVSLDSLSAEGRAELYRRVRVFDAFRDAQDRAPDQAAQALSRRSKEEQQFFRTLSSWGRENPTVPTPELFLSYDLQRLFDGRPGFSLDPLTNTATSITKLDQLILALSDFSKLKRVLHAWGDDDFADTIRRAVRAKGEPVLIEMKLALLAARGRIEQAGDPNAEAILLAKLSDSLGNAIAHELMELIWKESTQQCARYDGPLAGTAAGMTFFYTDYLSKIFADDWRGISPEGDIEGFESVVHHAPSTASCSEQSSPRSTRIWFGLRDEGYGREKSNAFRFAPNVTRIFAMGSDPGSMGAEVEPNASYRRFIRWWDKHYSQVAAWEPQYEVLNQLMKWSVVAQVARIAPNQSCLAFLDQVEIRTDHRFDQWVSQTSNLRWRGPIATVSAPQRVTECVPLLGSEPFPSCEGISTLVGGVSAATRAQVEAKPLRVAQMPDNYGRIGREAKPIAVSAGEVRFNGVRGAGGELKGVSVESRPGQVKFSADVDTSASQRGDVSSWDKGAPITQVEKSVQIQGKSVVSQQRLNQLVSEEIKISDLTEADVKFEVKPSTLEDAKSIAQGAVKHMQQDGVGLPSVSKALARSREVKLLDDGSIAVRIEQGNQRKVFAIMSSGDGTRGPPPPPPNAKATFVAGVPDRGPHRAGGVRKSSDPVVYVSILIDNDADSFIAQRSVRTLHSGDPALTVVKASLQNDDFEGAMKALGQQRSADAEAHVLAYALDRGDASGARRVVDGAIQRDASPSELRLLHDEVRKTIADRAREGKDANDLNQISMRLSIARRRQLMEGRGEGLIGVSSKDDFAVYLPPSYAAADLPPPVHRAGKPLGPDEKYVTRVILDGPPALPGKVEVDGTEYKRRADGREVLPAYGAVGSPYRLLSPSMRPVVFVTRCEDGDPNLPPCHDETVCDADGDGQYLTPEERACVDAVRGMRSKRAPAAKRDD